MLPANNTKHLPFLDLDFANLRLLLAQSDNGHSNGSALWISSQILAIYLLNYRPSKETSVCELGSGIGFASLVLSSLGCNVLATDLPFIVDNLLSPNITTNLSALPPSHGNITVSPLDWSQPIDWDAPTLRAVHPPFSLIISSDTVYVSDLISPLLQTLHTLCVQSASVNPTVILAIERRDSPLIDSFFAQASEQWKFRCSKVRHKHILKSIKNALGTDLWSRSDYEFVELWKMKLPQA